ncbi:MAG: hypothetical protein LBK66_00150 [Spirochaetaceae bacterium]|jgi:hypothetical protein|nr:hypothetical protein [Spirochaetaceae bacterium]
MSQKQKMTTEERLDVLMKAHEYRQAGNAAEANRITREELPMPRHLAEFAKEFLGADFLIKGNYNLSEVEAECGPDWLTK